MPTVHFTERELEDFLCTDDNLEKYLGLKFIARQVRVCTGVIDILAYNRTAKMFVIIELKQGELDFSAFEQVNRYYYSLRKKSSRSAEYRSLEVNDYTESKVRQFQRLIIGSSLHKSLNYIVERYEPKENYFIQYASTYYKLFGIEFDSPLNFNWVSNQQSEIQDSYYGG